jgi:tRNA (cmo5U34)-methyltransferase
MFNADTPHRDLLYSRPVAKVADFVFDEHVARVFADMARRSVPGYGTIISAIGLLSARYARPNSCCFDLGCSLGAAALAMRCQIQAPNCTIIAVDNSPAMVTRCRQNVRETPDGIPVEIICADIRDINVQNASIVVFNFTLQFIPPEDRLSLLSRTCQGMLPGGILILSEKLAFSDECQEALHTEMYHAFKKAQGYSDLEISQKRTALERVLIPETLAQHRERLRQAGFVSVEVWFQYFNFASLIALK